MASSDKVKSCAYVAAKKAIKDSLGRNKTEAEVLDGPFVGSYRVKYKIIGNPKVSIIIPTRDEVKSTQRCIESVMSKTDYDNYEILIVDNRSREPQTFRYYEAIGFNPKIRIAKYDEPFNYSKINNYAVSVIDSEYILFLNNDTKVISRQWLTAMLEHVQRKEVGIAGALLYYPNNTIQHAGVIVGLGGVASHSHKHSIRNDLGYMGRAKIIQNLSAVTAACLMTKRKVFNEVGGFNESFVVAFNDVDFCLRLRAAGYLIVWTPFAELYHHELTSRGQEDTDEKRARFSREVKYMRDKWGMILDNDPYYNPNLTRERGDFSIKI